MIDEVYSGVNTLLKHLDFNHNMQEGQGISMSCIGIVFR